jgi:CRP-like cAMP-binding protein
MVRDRETVAELGAGHFFGEIALLEPVGRTASVVARPDMCLRVMDQLEFASAMRNLATFARVLSDARQLRAAHYHEHRRRRGGTHTLRFAGLSYANAAAEGLRRA